MDIQARKIEFIQEFLKLQSEDAVSRLENFLRIEKESNIQPMTTQELNKRIDQSETDFEKNRFKSNSELESKYQ